MNNKKKVIILLGPPGSGKGTVAQFWKDRDSNVTHISLGSICREYALEDNEIGRLIKKVIDGGNLIDISLVEVIVSKIFDDFLKIELDANNKANILILDGFPRTFDQVLLFFKFFNLYLHKLDFYIIFLNLDFNIIEQRLINRYICSNMTCDKIYSFNNYIKDELCMKCKSLLYKRKDDTKNIIANRLFLHKLEEERIINFLNDKRIKFFKLDGDNTVDNIIHNIYCIMNINPIVNSNIRFLNV